MLVWASSREALHAPTARERLRFGAALLRKLSLYALGAVLFATELLRLSDWLLD